MANDAQQIITLEEVRLSYFYGFRPYEGTGKGGKKTLTYCTHAIFAPTSPNVAKVKAAQRAAAAAGYGAGFEAILQQLAAQDKLALHNGDISKAGKEEYAGLLYVSANNSVKPRIVATRGGVNVEIGEDDPCAPYSGCIANVMVAIWPQSANGRPSEWGKRINAALMGVQFVRHAPRIGGQRIATPDEFGIVATDADGTVPMAAAASAAPAAAPGSDLV